MNFQKAQAHLNRALELEYSFGGPKGISKRAKPQMVTEIAIKKVFSNLNPDHRYQCAKIGPFNVMFRFSTLKRRGGTETLDFDIVQIENKTSPRQGHGVEFFKMAMQAAHKFRRGVYIEQCITAASRALGRRLVALGLATEITTDNFISVYPPPSL